MYSFETIILALGGLFLIPGFVSTFMERYSQRKIERKIRQVKKDILEITSDDVSLSPDFREKLIKQIIDSRNTKGGKLLDEFFNMDEKRKAEFLKIGTRTLELLKTKRSNLTSEQAPKPQKDKLPL